MFAIRWFRLFAVAFALLYGPIRSDAEDPLILEYYLEPGEVVERCPLVAILTVRNVSDSTLTTIFPERGPYIHLAERASAVLQDQEGKTYALTYRGGLRAELTAPIAVHPMDSGDTRTVERLFSLIAWTPPPPRWAGTVDKRFRFLGPGVYTGHFEVALLHGKKLVSDKFELTIREAKGVDARARDLIQFRHVGFLEGRDVPINESVYRGGRSRHGVDWTHYREIQDILEKYPDSTYAEWIRFWKLYRYGPLEDALEYARAHPDFPLSDNLTLHIAEGFFGKEKYVRAREVLSEVSRLFPHGDTRAGVARLQRRLQPKFPARPVRKN